MANQQIFIDGTAYNVEISTTNENERGLLGGGGLAGIIDLLPQLVETVAEIKKVVASDDKPLHKAAEITFAVSKLVVPIMKAAGVEKGSELYNAIRLTVDAIGGAANGIITSITTISEEDEEDED